MFRAAFRGVRFVGQSYPMSEADREIQAAARALADELLPHEVDAELAGGELPDGLLEAHRRRVAELGFEAINMPKELGGGGFTAFQQVLVQEQIGRVTNALGWVVHTPASWLPKVATAEQLERWVVPTIRGERRECYAITEEGAGSDVDAIQATAHPRRRRLPAQRRQVARDLLQPRRPRVLPGQAGRRGQRRRPRHVRARHRHPRHPGGAHARLRPHLPLPPPGGRLRGRPRPRRPAHRRRGRRHGCSPTSGSATSG